MTTQFHTHIVSFLLLIRLFQCQYNYLCDWSTTFTGNTPTTTGTWSFQPSTCTVTLTGNDNSGEVSYLSGIPGSNLWSNYNVSVNLSIPNGGSGSNPWPALIFYVQNIGNSYWSGNYYALQIDKGSSELVFARFHDNYDGGTKISLPTINDNQHYNLKVVINGNTFDAYWNREYKMSWSDSNINAGSVGLRSYGTSSIWNNLYISGIPTSVPTSSPTPTTPTSSTTAIPTSLIPTAPPILSGIPRTIPSPGTWYDDYDDDTPLPGWTYTDDHAGYTNDRITDGIDGKTKYHGPYEAITNSGTSDDLYTISQQFYCQKRSSVEVFYNIYSCATENTDYVRLTLNGDLYPIQLPVNNGVSYSDSALNGALTQGACNSWLSFGAKGPYRIIEIDSNTLFTVEFTIRLSRPSEGIAISHLNITCDAITDAPTTAIPTTAIPTTDNPTTSQPTTGTPTTSTMGTSTGTAIPTTAEPTTDIPTTATPTTSEPTTAMPSTSIPSTAIPTTAIPTTGIPTTAIPTTFEPTTAIPTSTTSAGSIRTIWGQWQDDYDSTLPLPGWQYINNEGNVATDIVTIGNNNNNTYHGPYSGSNSGALTYSLSQSFYCGASVASSVDVIFDIFYCGISAGTYLEVSLNDSDKGQISLNNGEPYTDQTLNQCFSNGGWNKMQSQLYTIPTVGVDALFTVKLDFYLNGWFDDVAVSHLNITCNPITTEPTTSIPTTAVPTTATPTTASPITSTTTTSITATTTTTSAATQDTTTKATTTTPTATTTTTSTAAATTTSTTRQDTTSKATVSTSITTTPSPTSGSIIIKITDDPTKNPTEPDAKIDDDDDDDNNNNNNNDTDNNQPDDNNDEEQNISNITGISDYLLYIIIGIFIGCLLPSCLICCCIRKRKKKMIKTFDENTNNKHHNTAEIELGDIRNNGNKQRNYNTNNRNAAISIPDLSPRSSDDFNRVGSLSSYYGGENFEANLTNLAGANTLLMNDVIADMDGGDDGDNNDDDDDDNITAGHITAGGPDTDDGVINDNTPPTNENEYINDPDDDEDVIGGFQTLGGPNMNNTENNNNDDDDDVIGGFQTLGGPNMNDTENNNNNNNNNIGAEGNGELENDMIIIGDDEDEEFAETLGNDEHILVEMQTAKM